MNRRAVAHLACAAIMAASLAAGADEKSDALLRRAREAGAAAKTLQADLVVTMGRDGTPVTTQRGSVRILKPNFGEVRLAGPDGAPLQTTVSTGKETVLVMERLKQYRKAPADPKGRALGSLGGLTLAARRSSRGMSTATPARPRSTGGRTRSSS